MARADYTKPDHYARRAKQEGYAARSVYKLEEIDKKEGLFRAGQIVLDLGAAPGSWMSYATKKVGERGLVVGVDLKPLDRGLRPQERFLERDVNELGADELKELAPGFDLALSDMMPNTIGHKASDHLRSMGLAERALELAELLLKPGGHFLVKVFQGAEFESFRSRLRESFDKVKIVKPKSSRSTSREIYLLGLGKKSST